jgi:hypothetical protein
LSLSLRNPRRLIFAWLRCMGASARESRVSAAIYLLDVVGHPGLHQSGITSLCFVGCFSPGPRKNDLTIYWALGPFVRSFTPLVDPGDIYPPQYGKLYLVDFTKENVDLDACLIVKTNMGCLWHHCLAHVGMKNIHKLLKGEHVLGLTDVYFEKDRPCAACQAGKQVRTNHTGKNVMTMSRPLELLHMDLFRPIAYLSSGGSKYGLVIVDDFSRFTWVLFLQDKSETQGTLKRFLRRAQNEFELKVKKIRSDNGSEFKNLQVKEFLEEKGIKHEFSAPYILQQNGVVERKNRTLIDMARTMLGEYKTPERFW